MSKRLTDEQLLARDEAKVARRRERIARRIARKCSAEVRSLERDRAVFLRYVNERGWGGKSIGLALEEIDAEIAAAVKESVP